MNKLLTPINYIVITFFIVLLIQSCNKKDNINIIKQAAQTTITPQESLELLNSVNVNKLNKADYFYYVLMQIRALDKVGNNITLFDSVALNAKHFFRATNDNAKTAFASFVAARIYEKQNNFVKALYYYLEADEWAKQANYNIPDLDYYIIPYNIANLYTTDGKHFEALSYCNKALECNINNNLHKLYVNELVATNYQYLNNLDSALLYCNKAITIDELINNIESQNRLIRTKISLLKKQGLFIDAKKECYNSIAFQSNNIDKGKLYLDLATVYDKEKNVDSTLIALWKKR